MWHCVMYCTGCTAVLLLRGKRQRFLMRSAANDKARLHALLLSECNFSGYMIHSVYNRKRLQLITQISDNPAARLKSLFDSDTDSLYLSACRLYNLNQSLQSAAISEKIVDNQNTIPFTEKLFGYDDLIFVL